MNLEGAGIESIPIFREGRIHPVSCYRRGVTRLPVTGLFANILDILNTRDDINAVVQGMQQAAVQLRGQTLPELAFAQLIQALELMISEGWVQGSFDPTLGRLQLNSPMEGESIHSNRDLAERLARLEQH